MGGGGAAHARHVVGWGLGVQVGRLERRLNGGAQVERQFRLAWADHGDDISRQYAGTGALKSGFTRTGKRGAGGLLDDGAKSAVRYLRNNFADGRRQDALDLLGGAYVPSKGAPILPSLCKPYPTPGRRLTTRRGRRADKPSPFKPQASPALPFAAALAALGLLDALSGFRGRGRPPGRSGGLQLVVGGGKDAPGPVHKLHHVAVRVVAEDGADAKVQVLLRRRDVAPALSRVERELVGALARVQQRGHHAGQVGDLCAGGGGTC